MLCWRSFNVEYPNIDLMTFRGRGFVSHGVGKKYGVDCTHPLIQTLRVCVSRDLCVCDDPTTELACPDWLNGPGFGRRLELSQITPVCLDTSYSPAVGSCTTAHWLGTSTLLVYSLIAVILLCYYFLSPPPYFLTHVTNKIWLICK